MGVHTGGRHACVSVYAQAEQARQAVGRLRDRAFSLGRVSVLGHGYHGNRLAMGMHQEGASRHFHGIQADFWEGLWRQLSGAALLWLPGFGPLAAAGPVTALLIHRPDKQTFDGGFDLLEGALYALGIPAEDVRAYVHCLNDDALLLIVHDGREQVERAYQLLHPVSQQLTVHHA